MYQEQESYITSCSITNNPGLRMESKIRYMQSRSVAICKQGANGQGEISLLIFHVVARKIGMSIYFYFFLLVRSFVFLLFVLLGG